ncbi:glycosyltransferase family 2 protein [Aquiflexum gelatinilyticum]|uniref:Glycosyltransferase family 2 protein n=1 Tax=Aquiflexum gelatinilyticum TaxID=2961943 RepID=A0A9X2P767_9BACT|nr:glycosyltransferase family 2 protein [Aquiflexum gelatinilyticum]MCR9013465.1 glycosyltransferase family 2 protein [Aquiflexum gelatinilyticum]MCS4436639.1 glycosyltransferase family 2 protein [Aquiflexum gelatinilyticum]
MQNAAIVILNYNGVEMLRKFLPSVTQFSTFQVIVADNGSTDCSVDLLLNNFPQIRLIRLESNFGFTGGYNRALEIIRGDFGYYILLNSDVEVEKAWDVKLIRFLEENPKAAAVQPKILSFPNRGYFDYAGAGGGFLDGLGYPYCRGRIFDTVEKDEHQYDDTIPVDWASGACMAIRASLFHQAGGFDERFFAHMEEIDICWKIRKMGYSIHYLGISKVMHVGGGTLHRTNPWKTFLNFRNNLLMLHQNLKTSCFASVYLKRILLDLLAAFVFVVRGNFQDGKAVLQAHFAFHKMKSKSLKSKEIENIGIIGNANSRSSILWDYYIRGKRTYQDL